MADKKIKIVIAEDHRLVRKAFFSLLEDNPEFKVVGEAANGKELLELLKGTEPDLVLLDIEMPVMNGREALMMIRKRHPEQKVIMLSIHNEVAYMAEFISLGARAYIPKNTNEKNFFKTLYEVQRTGHYFENNASDMLKMMQHEQPVKMLAGQSDLSIREVEILKKICDGKTNKEIAHSLNITATTVNFHRVNIYKKTESHNIAELIKYGIKNGIINLHK